MNAPVSIPPHPRALPVSLSIWVGEHLSASFVLRQFQVLALYRVYKYRYRCDVKGIRSMSHIVLHIDTLLKSNQDKIKRYSQSISSL